MPSNLHGEAASTKTRRSEVSRPIPVSSYLMTVLLVALFAEGLTEVSWAQGSVVESTSPIVIRLDDPSIDTVVEVARSVAGGQAISAAWCVHPLSRDRLWMASEWRGRLAVEHGLDQVQSLERLGWRRVSVSDLFLILAPEREHPASEDPVLSAPTFRSGLRGREPLVIRVQLHDSLANDEELFGDLVPAALGGSSALLVLSGARPGASTVGLRNLGSLELTWLDGDDTMTDHRRHGTVKCRAVGLSKSTAPSFAAFANPTAMAEAWEHRFDPAWSYWVLVELSALVDPPVWIPVGQVFGQRAVNGIQTLAVAVSTRVTVTPGQLVPLALPVWCLNKDLSAPDGEPVDPTPLLTRYQEGTSQRQVWEDRTRIQRSA
jgi:hypothetical protein